MSFDIPKNHPRYSSLVAREKIMQGVLDGITHMTGLVAQGRGEAFDYLLGEKSHDFSLEACKVAATLLLTASHPVISINGNTSVLVTDEIVSLSKTHNIPVEINLFHDAFDRRDKIAQIYETYGITVLAKRPDAKINKLTSDRAKVDSKGIYIADVVLVALEDGDRTEILVDSGKKVIAIDLNPLSRTPQMSTVPIIDNVQRALPLIEKYMTELSGCTEDAYKEFVSPFSKEQILQRAEAAIRQGS